MPRAFDCIIIGAGIAGTTSALVLAQTGLHVLVIEAGTHPRFAIGESLVPTTTLGFEYLARTYGIPELRQISHYPELKELGHVGWPKLGFWFGHHRDGLTLQPGHELMLVTPGLPLGPDVHILRSDVDSFLVSRLRTYGVDYQDRTTLTEFESRPDGAKLVLNREGKLETIHTRFVLDCSGHKSFLAEMLGLRETPSTLHTNTRVIFSHFGNVPFLEDVLGKPCTVFRTKRDASTIHHCFEGGWFWFIRFNNGVTSVGLVLDRETYPDNDQPAEDEFRSFVTRFPTIEAQLGSASSVRPFVKTGRIQFTSRTIAGDRYLLAPHAASFVDPLFSTGVDLTVAFITRAVPVIHRMMEEDNFSAELLAPLQRWYSAEINSIDRIIHGMYRSFRHIDIFKQYWRCWIYVTLFQYFMQHMYEPDDDTEFLSHYGASLPSWNAQLERMYLGVTAQYSRNSESVAALLKSTMDNYPEPFNHKHTNWAIGSAEPCRPTFDRPITGVEWFQRLLSEEPALARRARADWLVEMQHRFQAADEKLAEHYRTSKAKGTAFHQGVDFIRAQQIK